MPAPVTLTYTGADASVTVPNGATHALVRMWAAGGGSNGATAGAGDAARGGPGGFVKFTIAVTSGESLTGKVGQGGRKGSSTRVPGTGGGRTQLARGATVLGIAGAGGGAGGYGSSNAQSYGGKGGGTVGGDGQDGGNNGANNTPGRGGTQSAGGAAGTPTGSATAGAVLSGGNGDLTSSAGQDGGWPNGGRASTFAERGGGGGDGWFGGGGGGGTGSWGNGGGGGSSYTVAGATDITHQQGTNTAAPATSETGYAAGVATPGENNNDGGNGLIYIEWIAYNAVTGTAVDDAGNPAAGRIVRLHDRSTGAVLGIGTTNASGVYSIAINFVGEVQRIVLDDDAGTLHNDLIDRVMLS